jgi:DNA-binding PadR family transcriptional regulator
MANIVMNEATGAGLTLTEGFLKRERIRVAVPLISHLQWLVIVILGTSEMTGKDLRSQLASRGMSKSGPSFYQMMGRLEEADYVRGKYVSEVIDGQIIKERVYQVTPSGQRVRSDTEKFYAANRLEPTLSPELA